MTTRSEEPGKTPPRAEDPQLLSAFQTIFGVVPRFGGAVLAIVTIGYFVGWRISLAYYGAFGAEWVTTLLSPSELLQQSYGPLSGFVSGLLLTTLYTVDGTLSKKWVELADIITTLLALLLLLLGLGMSIFVGVVGAAFFSLGVSFLLPFSLAFSVAQHAFAIRDRSGPTGSRSLQIVYLLWIIAAIQLPMWSGQPRGELAADPDVSTLPRVNLGSETWRLLLARQDRFVLVKLQKGQRPIVRIVPVERVERVQANSPEAEHSNPGQTAPGTNTHSVRDADGVTP